MFVIVLIIILPPVVIIIIIIIIIIILILILLFLVAHESKNYGISKLVVWRCQNPAIQSQTLLFWRTNIAMENAPFQDVFPIENGDIPFLCQFTTGYILSFTHFSRFLYVLQPGQCNVRNVLTLARTGRQKFPARRLPGGHDLHISRDEKLP